MHMRIYPPKQPASQSLPFHILITTTPPPLLDYDDSQIWNRYRKHGSQRLLSKCPCTVKHHVQALTDLPLIIDDNGPSSVIQIFSNHTQRYDLTTRTRDEANCPVMKRSYMLLNSFPYPLAQFIAPVISELAAAASKTCISRHRSIATIHRASGVLCLPFQKPKIELGLRGFFFGLSLVYDIAAAPMCFLLRWHGCDDWL